MFHLICSFKENWQVKIPFAYYLLIIVNFLIHNFTFSGGLAEEVDEKVLQAAFIPFGDIVDIQIPLDYETGNIKSPLLCHGIIINSSE